MELCKDEASPEDGNGSELPHADTLIVDMSSMKKVVSIDKDQSTVTVEAGISWESLVQVLKEHGLAVENLSAYTKVTVAGAAGTGTHGSGSNILASQFLSMQIVDAKGQLHCIRDPKLFTHLGVLGILSTITLRCVPFFYIKQSCYRFPEWAMLEHLFGSERLMVNVLEEVFSMMLRISIKDAGHPVLCFLRKKAVDGMDDSHSETFFEAPLVRGCLRNHYGGSQSTEKTTLTDCYDAILPDHSTLSRPSDAPMPYYQGEYFVPLSDGLEAINAFLLQARKNASFEKVLPSGFKIRFVRSDDHYMSPCTDLPRTPIFLAFQLSLYGPYAEVDAVLKDIEDGFQRAKVFFTSHWGKCTHGGHAKINGHMKDQAELFDEKRRMLDPENCFLWENSELGKLLVA